MTARLTTLIETLIEHTPAAVDDGEIAPGGDDPPVWCDDEGWLRISLRMVLRDDGMIRDVREQEVVLGRVDGHPLDRWRCYLEGTLRSAAAILRSRGGIDACMPFEVFLHRQVLDDPTLESADDFAAQLGGASRLAAWNAAIEALEWAEALEPCGLADRALEVKALRRPSIRLALEPIDEEDEHDDDDAPPSIGEARIGGDPDLPPELPWPSVEGVPLVFVGQFDLAALAGSPAAAELPPVGVLSFFYAPFPPDGWHLEHPVAVLHFADPSVLVRRRSPDPRERLRPHSVECSDEEILPQFESYYTYAALRPEEEVRAFYESLDRGAAGPPPIDPGALSRVIIDMSTCDLEGPTHRLLGHPSSIQGDPYLDVETRRDPWEGRGEGSDEAMAARQRALGWRLLLQIEAAQDDELLLNQDGGYFYFMIRADALAAHDWSQARGCLQCH